VRPGVKILIVEDDPTLRPAMQRLLEHGGHQVEAVDSGQAALALLARRQFDIVITDFSMPGMAGDQLVRRIREQLPRQRIIMATAFAEEYQVFGEPTGSVDALIYKPFSLKDLHETIAQVLDSAGDLVPPPLEPPAPEQFPSSPPPPA
jgi:two-component system chemotaxis response regulator CheY